MTTADHDAGTTTIPGIPGDDARDLLTGVSHRLADQFHLPTGDSDVARLLGSYEDTFSKRLGRDIAAYANQQAHIITTTLGDRPGRRVTRDAVADGLRNLPDHAAVMRTARVHAIVRAVTETAATVCTQRQAEDVRFDQHITTAKADQLDEHPKFARYAAHLQRGLLLGLAPVAMWLVLFVARRLDGWPGPPPDGAGDALSEYAELAPFAVSVILLGVVTALVVASAKGEDALRRMLRIGHPASVLGIGAALAALVGALSGTASSWSGTTALGDAVLGGVVWAVLGAAGYLVAFALIALVVNHEAAERVTSLLSGSVKLDAEKQEAQAVAAKRAIAAIHDTALHIVGSRAIVLVTQYYRVNLLARRNSRTSDLIAFVESDIQAVITTLGQGAAPCVCATPPSHPGGGTPPPGPPHDPAT